MSGYLESLVEYRSMPVDESVDSCSFDSIGAGQKRRKASNGKARNQMAARNVVPLSGAVAT
jgi:hypothetical protein